LSTACGDFPATVTLGESIQLNTTGAILCFDPGTAACRLTTNTFSDGTNPCANSDIAALFFSSTGSNVLSTPSATGNVWHIVSISDGTLDANYVDDLTTSEVVTAVIEDVGASVQYTLVFVFNGGTSFTLTSFTQT